jgi:hypothetical protein
LEAEIRAKFGAQLSPPLEVIRVCAGVFTIGLAATEYLERIADRHRKPEHVRNQKVYIRELLRYFRPETPFSEIDQTRVDAYTTFCREPIVHRKKGPDKVHREAMTESGQPVDPERKRAPSYVNNYLTCLRALLAIANKIRDPDDKPALSMPIHIELLACTSTKRRLASDVTE